MSSGKCVYYSTLLIAAASLAGPLRAQFVYVANYCSNNISAYSIDATGALTPISGSPFAAGLSPVAVTVDPSGRFLYVANSGDTGSRNDNCPANTGPNANTVSAYSIGATGALTLIGSVTAGDGPFSVAVDPTDRFVYVANQFSNSVSAYSIGATGALTSIGSPVAAGANPFSVAVDPTDRFVYVANILGSNVSEYSINATTGALSSIGTVAAGFEPASVAVSPNGLFAWVANFLSANIQTYLIGPTGALSAFGAPASAPGGPTSVAVDPTGRFVYATSYVGDAVLAYLGITGTLTPNGSAAAGTNPRILALAVDPTARFVYTANFGSSNVSELGINANGTLTHIGEVAAGTNPASVAVTPPAGICPLGTGFWKNHLLVWPVTTLTIGGTTYTEAQLITVLTTASKGDAVLILADSLIAADLNIANGSNGSSVSAVIADANSLLTGINLLVHTAVETSSAVGNRMVTDADTLDSFNNGNLTPSCTAIVPGK